MIELIGTILSVLPIIGTGIILIPFVKVMILELIECVMEVIRND